MNLPVSRRYRMGALILAGGVALTLAACSSSSGGSSTPSASSSATASGALSAKLAQASALISEYTGQPQYSDGLKPLSGPPPKGLNVIYLANSGAPQDILNGKAFTQAADLLGWHPSTIDYAAGDTASLGSALDQAIQDKPDAIVIAGEDPSLFANGLKEANAAGIPVFDSAVDVQPSTNGLAGVTIGVNYMEEGSILGAAIIAKASNGGADSAAVIISGEPTLTFEANVFKTALQGYCPSCQVTTITGDPTQIGTGIPATVVSALQANPNIKYLYFPYGDVSIGVAAALKSAGINVKIVSSVASANTYADLKSGASIATIGTSAQSQGFLDADIIARYFLNGKKPLTTSEMPLRIYNSSNDQSATLPADPPNYVAQFKAIWGLSS